MRKGDYVGAGGGPANTVCVSACRKAQGHGPERAHCLAQWVMEGRGASVRLEKMQATGKGKRFRQTWLRASASPAPLDLPSRLSFLSFPSSIPLVNSCGLELGDCDGLNFCFNV